MYSKSPSRNNRSRGIKVKHIIQICLLVAVFFWLIYQVKHSHEKKKEFDEKDAKLASDTQSGNEILRLGRKDISRVSETGTDDKLTGEDDEENEVDQAENRHEDDEQEIEENRTEDREDEEDTEKGGEDDEIDQIEVKNEEEFVDEEKKDNDDGEKEDNEESEAVLEDHDHEGNTQQEREEHYKADDASSEVAHDTSSIISDTENVTLKHTDGTSELIIDGKENVSQISVQPLLQENSLKPIEGTNSSDIWVSEIMEHKDNLTVSEYSSSENSTALTVSTDHAQVTGNLTQLESEKSAKITQAQNATSEDSHNENSNLTLSLFSHSNTSDLATDENQSVMNSTEVANTTMGFSSEVKLLALAENITGGTETKVDDVNSADAGTVDNLGSNSSKNVTGEENENSISDSANDNVDDFASSITQEEKELQTDPVTLPDLKVGVQNADDVEAG